MKDFFNYYIKRLETDSSFEVLIIASPSSFATEIILIFLDPLPTVSLKIVSPVSYTHLRAHAT